MAGKLGINIICDAYFGMEGERDRAKDITAKAVEELSWLARAPKGMKLDVTKSLVRRARDNTKVQQTIGYLSMVIPPTWHILAMANVIRDKSKPLKYKVVVFGENVALYSAGGATLGWLSNAMPNIQLPVVGQFLGPAFVGIMLAGVYGGMAPVEWRAMGMHNETLKKKRDGTYYSLLDRAADKVQAGICRIVPSGMGKRIAELREKMLPHKSREHIAAAAAKFDYTGWNNISKLRYFVGQYQVLSYTYFAYLAMHFL